VVAAQITPLMAVCKMRFILRSRKDGTCISRMLWFPCQLSVQSRQAFPREAFPRLHSPAHPVPISGHVADLDCAEFQYLRIAATNAFLLFFDLNARWRITSKPYLVWITTSSSESSISVISTHSTVLLSSSRSIGNSLGPGRNP
jgi:hypothetical protein